MPRLLSRLVDAQAGERAKEQAAREEAREHDKEAAALQETKLYGNEGDNEAPPVV